LQFKDALVPEKGIKHSINALDLSLGDSNCEKLSNIHVFPEFSEIYSHSLADTKIESAFVGIKSIEEGISTTLVRDKLHEYRQFNINSLIQVYPSSPRGASSFDPLPHWKAGCQCVSLENEYYGKIACKANTLKTREYK
jgi:hypothetical protein